MRTKVLLLNPPSRYRYAISIDPPLGILYIAAFLRKNGIAVWISDLNTKKKWKKELFALIRECVPSIVGISSIFSNRDEALQLARLVKMINKDIIVVIGGHHPTIVPLEYMSSHIDYIVPFEGEKVMLDFVCAVNKDAVEGVISRQRNSVNIINSLKRNLIGNLDELPFPAYDMIDVLNYHAVSHKKRPQVSMITSRGCPQCCTFCSQAVSGRRWRARSAENVVEEMLWLKEKVGVRDIIIEDDNFTFDSERVYRICDLIRSENLRIVWQLSNIRADGVTKNLLKTMKNAGCYQVTFSPEVGDEKDLKRIKKGIKLEQFRRAAQWCKELDIVHISNFIMGFPFQNREGLQKTIDFAVELDPLFMNLNKLMPFPGTEIFNESSDQEKERYRNNYSYHYRSEDKILEKMYKKAYLKFYLLRPYKIFEIIKVVGVRQFFLLLRFAFVIFFGRELLLTIKIFKEK